MSEEQEQESYSNAGEYVNQGTNFVQDASVVRYRLSTDDIQKRFEVFLKGKVKEVYMAENGKVVEKITTISKAKVNNDGYQAIMGFFSQIVNTQTLQANLETKADYNEKLAEYLTDISTEMMINKEDWGIKTVDHPVIINTFMASVGIILTHALKAGTRHSLSASTKVTQAMVTQPESKGLFGSGLFKR